MNMEQFHELMSAAWPWIATGLLLALFFALFYGIDARRKKSGNNNYSSEGIAFGMSLGTAWGIVLHINIGVAMVVGMIIGLYIGSKKEKKQKKQISD